MTAFSAAAVPIRNASAIIWDEVLCELWIPFCFIIIILQAPMAPREALDAIDKSLRNIMGNDLLFGGKTMVLGGDFRSVIV